MGKVANNDHTILIGPHKLDNYSRFQTIIVECHLIKKKEKNPPKIEKSIFFISYIS